MTNSFWNIGEIKRFDENRGFGFVKCLNDNQEYFVHISKILTSPVLTNDKVVFQIAPSRKKLGALEAINLSHLSKFKTDIEFLILEFSKTDQHSYKREILNAIPPNYVSSLAEKEISLQKKIISELDYKRYLAILDRVNKIFDGFLSKDNISTLASDYALKVASTEILIKLWFNNIIQSTHVISEVLKRFNENNEKLKLETFKKLSANDKIILFKSLKSLQNPLTALKLFKSLLKIESDANTLRELISLVFEKDDFNKSFEEQNEKFNDVVYCIKSLHGEIAQFFIHSYYNSTFDYFKLKLWLYDYIDTADYDLFETNFILLQLDEQKRFIKKYFFLLSQNIPGISIHRILNLRNQTFLYSEGKKYSLDFSCNIVLSSIEKLLKDSFLNEEDIFSLLTKHVETDTSSLLSLNGFFESCLGRAVPESILPSIIDLMERNEERMVIHSLKRIASPRNVEFCEGVRYKGDGKDRVYGHNCWWCRGGNCYSANQSISLPNHYNDYTLGNFLTILKIPFDKKGYFDFLGLLNKVNNYLKHLNCRACKHILRPHKEGYFSYYRVSNFVCSNPKCENKESIYLNHCIGVRRTVIKSKCDNLIDSRDTTRCNYSKHNPADKYQRYGPYICNECGSCCSQKSLEKKHTELIERKWNMQPGLEWKVAHNVGHLERDEIFCYKCGTEMMSNEGEYNEVISNLERSTYPIEVLKKGVNINGFWYMVRADESFFERASQVGLRVRNTNSSNLREKFISQGVANSLICRNCEIKYSKSKAEFFGYLEAQIINI